MLVAGSRMDKDRAREQKRASAPRATLSRRQHKLLSSVHLSRSNGKRRNLSGPGVTGSGEDVEDGSPADCWKKENGTSDSGGSSSNDDGGGMGGGHCRSGEGDKEPCTPPIASTSSKKRVKLNAKVSDGYAGVDPAVVPRKLRSAMSKRASGSLSPSFPNGRKKDHLANIGAGCLPFSRNVEVTGSLTKDEEDAVETLSALAQMMPDCTPTHVCVDGIPKHEISDSKASTSANVEVPTGSTEDLYCSEKFLDYPEGPIPVTEFNMTKQSAPVVDKECGKLDLELNQPAKVDTNELDLMKFNTTVDLNDTADPSAMGSAETAPQLFLGNGVVEPPSKAFSPKKPHNTYSSGTLNLDSKCQEKTERVTHVTTCREEANSGTWVALPVPAGGRPDAACCSSEPGPSRTAAPAEKTLMLSRGRRQTWKGCATHVYIGYLIRHCQMTDGKSLPTLCNKRPMLDPIAVTAEASRLQNGVRSLSTKETDICIVDRKPYEMKPGPSHDKGQKPVQQLQNVPGVYTQPKQNCELLSPASEFQNSGSKMDSSAKFSSTNLNSAAHHSLVSFSLPPSYSSPYPDQLAAQAAAAQQVQLQLPQYLATPFYGFHLGHMGGPAKQQQQQTSHHQLQQQQLWQAHVTQYWMPPVLPKWQNGRPLDPSHSLIPGAQMQPVLIHPPTVEAKGVVASHHRPPSILHQMLPIPLQAANRSK